MSIRNEFEKIDPTEKQKKDIFRREQKHDLKGIVIVRQARGVLLGNMIRFQSDLKRFLRNKAGKIGHSCHLQIRMT